MNTKKWMWDFVCPPAKAPDPALFLQEPRETVKKNPVRTVFRVTDGNGKRYYLKQDSPRTFAGILRAFFRSKNRMELESARLAGDAGLPCPDYVALGTAFPETMLVTRELEGFISAAEFRYTKAESDPAARTEFLHALACLIRTMVRENIFHPDLHIGNVMVRPEKPGELALIDLYGVRRLSSLSEGHRRRLCRIFTEFSGIPGFSGTEYLRETEAVLNLPDAEILWRSLRSEAHERILREWPKRVRQIESGSSKFARAERIGNDIYYLRNTRWFTPRFIDVNLLEPQEYTEPEGLALWLESFQRDLLQRSQSRPPLAMRRSENKIILFYEESF